MLVRITRCDASKICCLFHSSMDTDSVGNPGNLSVVVTVSRLDEFVIICLLDSLIVTTSVDELTNCSG